MTMKEDVVHVGGERFVPRNSKSPTIRSEFASFMQLDKATILTETATIE